MSDDTISRKAAIDALWKINNELDSVYYTSAIHSAVDAIESLPSAERRGRWIPDFGGKFKGGAYWFRCSRCGRIVPNVRNGGWDFCPNCGAKMEGEEE